MTATRRNRAQLSVEALETRCLLSAAPQVTAVYDVEKDPLPASGTASCTSPARGATT
jgi:hypothetical protein